MIFFLSICSVDDILWDGNPVKTTFELLDGTKISLKDYVYKQHKIELMDDRQPILVAKSRNKVKLIIFYSSFAFVFSFLQGPLKDSLVYLIPELCQMTGITDEMRKDFQMMKELTSFTQLDPSARAKSIKDLIRKIKGTVKFDQFDLHSIKVAVRRLMIGI